MKTYTKEQWLKFQKEIIAHEKGKQIEVQEKDGTWIKTNNPAWLTEFYYRIAPEKKLIPFTFDDADMLRGKWVKNKEGKLYSFITSINDYGIECGDTVYSYKELLEDKVFMDCSPCGKYETK